MSHKWVLRIYFEGIHSGIGTQKRNGILKRFDKKVPGRIYILSSCRTISEGIDTKWANMEVPLDPTKSIMLEAQKIGRITRMPEPNMPPSILLIPVLINKAEYEAAKTDIDRDKLIRKELNENRDFTTLLNVISAFKYQFDKEIYEFCLRYPTMFSPNEIKKNLEKQGFQIEESKGTLVDNVNYLVNDPDKVINISGDGSTGDLDLNEISDQIERPIEIHSQNMEQPIVTFGSMDEESSDPIRLFQNEDGNYQPIVEKDSSGSSSGSTGRKSVHPPKKRNRPFKINYDQDLLVLWNISETQLYEKFGKGILDCELSWSEKLEERWNEMYDLLIEYIDNNKEIIPVHQTLHKSKNIGGWCSYQRSMKRINKLSKKKIGQLEKIKGWFWDRDKWNIMYDLLINYSVKNGVVPHTHTIYEKYKLGQWCQTQRSNKKQLSLDKIQKLEKIPGWSWNIYLDQWDKNYKLFMDYVSSNKGIFPSTKTIYKGVKIGMWYAYQKSKVKTGKYYLSTTQIKDLEKINGWSLDTIADKSWNKFYCLLIQYTADNHKIPPKKYRDKHNNNLGGWCGDQRMKKKNNKLSLDKIVKLDKIPEWYWDKYEKLWNEGYGLVLEYTNKNNYQLPVQNIFHKGKKIGSWCNN